VKDLPDVTYRRSILANGLTVIGENNEQAQSFAAGYFVNAGARDEIADNSGVSHFLEHMMFKGTPRRTAEVINREFDELGARHNAYTSEDRTVYYGAVLPERASELLDLLTDMMRPSLRSIDFDLEKQVILEEIAMYEDRPNFRVFDEGNKVYFRNHPVGNTILGTQDSIERLSIQQMQHYHDSRYAPNNMIVAVAGAYDWDAVVGILERLTVEWVPAEVTRSYPELRLGEGDVALYDDHLSRAHLAVYAPGVSAQDERRYCAAVLAACIGDVSGSRLYWSLVDQGLVDTATLSHDSADRLGTFMGYLSTTPALLEEVRERLRADLTRFQAEGPTAEEWQRAQRKLATVLTLGGETSFGRLMSLGSSYLYTWTYNRVEDALKKILATRRENGMELLEERPFDALFTLSLGPESSHKS
jgi:predicted Zn-dependent peptidase